jgi:hypothetical protein
LRLEEERMNRIENDNRIMKQPELPARSIRGWGADKVPADRPAYPKEKASDVNTVRGNVGARMTPPHRIHMSIEHPDLAPVFGTTCPPRGLSGKLRDFAYQFGEGRLAHWLTLLAADRIDVLEGRFEDLSHGRVPHPIAERGLTAHDGSSRSRNLLIAGAALGVLAAAVIVQQARE